MWEIATWVVTTNAESTFFELVYERYHSLVVALVMAPISQHIQHYIVVQKSVHSVNIRYLTAAASVQRTCIAR